jgi:hypothetical protein
LPPLQAGWDAAEIRLMQGQWRHGAAAAVKTAGPAEGGLHRGRAAVNGCTCQP